MMTDTSLAGLIDHTCLDVEADDQRIHRLCEEARTAGFYAVCVRPNRVSLCKRLLAGSPVKVATVIGFPEETLTRDEANLLGDTPLTHRLAEISEAEEADEFDIVMDIKKFRRVKEWIGTKFSRQVAAVGDRTVKFICETALHDEAALETVIRVIRRVANDYPETATLIKTSTGYVTDLPPVSPEVVSRIRTLLGEAYPRIGIKASGGVKTAVEARALVAAGATRLGSSRGIELISD